MSISQKHLPTLTICIILLMVGAESCTAPQSKSELAEYGPVFEKVMLTENRAFRGFNLGDPLDSVKAKERAKLIEADENYLYYESKLDSAGSFNISYSFDEKGLSEIQSDIFIDNMNEADDVFHKFKSYFDAHYGSSETHMGFTVWTIKSEIFGEIRINLSDESADFTANESPGKISLWIYPDKN